MGLRDFFSRLRKSDNFSPEKIAVRQYMAFKTYEELKEIADTIANSDNPEEIFTAAQFLIPFLKRVVGARKAEIAHRNLSALYNILKEYDSILAEDGSDKEFREAREKIFRMLKDYAFRIYGLAVKNEDVDYSRPIFISKPETYVDTLGVLEAIGFFNDLKRHYINIGRKGQTTEESDEDSVWEDES